MHILETFAIGVLRAVQTCFQARQQPADKYRLVVDLEYRPDGSLWMQQLELMAQPATYHLALNGHVMDMPAVTVTTQPATYEVVDMDKECLPPELQKPVAHGAGLLSCPRHGTYPGGPGSAPLNTHDDPSGKCYSCGSDLQSVVQQPLDLGTFFSKL